MAKVFIGVDGEMTGVLRDQNPPNRLIQVGVSLGAADTFTSDIGWAEGTYSWEERALEVNKFDHERIRSGPPAEQVDILLSQWLKNRGVGHKDGIAVGWNVGSFDFEQFLIPTLPLTVSLFSYRFADLNSLTFALQQSRMVPGAELGGNENKWKNAAKEVSGKMLGPSTNWHDAGYDAAASLLQFYWLSGVIGGLRNA